MNPSPENTPPRLSLWRRLEDEFGISQLIRDYMIPVETNSIWYLLGGVNNNRRFGGEEGDQKAVSRARLPAS